jgi:hypothetical protein
MFFLKIYIFRVFGGGCVKEIYIVCSVVSTSSLFSFFSFYLIVLLFYLLAAELSSACKILPSGLTDTERKEYPFA